MDSSMKDEVDVGTIQEENKEETKPKQRKRRRKKMLTGISKQRRLANERERRRLQVVNSAFVSLKNVLPLPSVDQKISRIEIVRLASRHIASLMQLLHHDEDLQGVENEDFCCSGDEIVSDDELMVSQTDWESINTNDHLQF